MICALLALLAFAGNSILCRLALGTTSIDPANFTAIRLISGAITLLAIVLISKQTKQTNQTKKTQSKGSWLAASMLFLYAVSFSYGYISLDTGTGALILFGAVQISMIIINVILGNRLHYAEWFGLCLAFSGFVYLIIPSLTTPSLLGFILMSVAGLTWGIYTLVGKTSTQALNDTAYNFLRTIPMLFVLVIFTFEEANITLDGVLLAIVSGAITSGLGYAVWYIALGGLTVTQSAVIQLLVPIIAALGGVIFTHEVITLRLLESSGLVLGGILIVILGKKLTLSSTHKT